MEESLEKKLVDACIDAYSVLHGKTKMTPLEKLAEWKLYNTLCLAGVIKQEEQEIVNRSDPRKHVFEELTDGVCWWCGKSKKEHITMD